MILGDRRTVKGGVNGLDVEDVSVVENNEDEWLNETDWML